MSGEVIRFTRLDGGSVMIVRAAIVGWAPSPVQKGTQIWVLSGEAHFVKETPDEISRLFG